MVSSQDEPLFLHDDDEVTPAEYSKGFWKILIVDDDQEIHAVTKMALADVIISGRQLEFFHAYSGSEALDRLTEHDDIAMVLLDVVMETDDAGLKVAQAIREQLAMMRSGLCCEQGNRVMLLKKAL